MAMSGLCYVHPHLGEQCKAASAREAEIDVCGGVVSPERIAVTEPLRRSVAAMREKFAGILASENLSLDSVQSATIRFQFGSGRWPTSCYAVVQDANGSTVGRRHIIVW